MDRDLVVARLLERGSTYREIAERLGVSIARVQQIIRTAQGLCTFCSRPAETKTLCARHAQRMRDRAARLREADREGYNRRQLERYYAQRLSDPAYRRRKAQLEKRRAERATRDAVRSRLLAVRVSREVSCLRANSDHPLARAIADGIEAGRTYSEIGAELGLTRERIRQIAAQAASGTNYSYVGVRYTAVGGRS